MPVSHLNALKALEASLRLGSFKRAAEELGVTPAAVGQQVRTLEEWLGHELFVRDKKRIVPSATANGIAGRLTTHMSGLSDVLEELRASNTGERLAITLPASFAENWFAERVSDFWRAHPSVDLRLSAANRVVDLRSESFDFAIRYCGDVEPHLESLDLFGDYVVPICTPAFAKQFGLHSEGTSLDGVPLIHLEDRTPDPSWASWEFWAKAQGTTLPSSDVALRYKEVASGLHAARLDQGLVLAGLVEAFSAISSGELVAPFGTERNCPTHYAYRLVWLKSRQLNSVHSAFVEWVQDIGAGFHERLHKLARRKGEEHPPL